MKKICLLSLGLPLLTGCGRLAYIPYSPEQTPESWLSIQPYLPVSIGSLDFILVQPSSTVFVYLLGLIAIWAGMRFLRMRAEHKSRLWWGVALILWGLGALSAGTSYQAFSYEIKCAGQALCAWTSWWEIVYLLLSVGSIDAMLAAVAHSSTAGRLRQGLLLYALANITVYTLIVLTGALVPVQFLISFELLLIVSAPNIVIFLILNGRRYLKNRNEMDRALLVAWIWLIVTLAAYFGYLMLGFTEPLWERGIWFSENDVLHLGLISWMLFLAIHVSRRVGDLAGRVVRRKK